MGLGGKQKVVDLEVELKRDSIVIYNNARLWKSLASLLSLGSNAHLRTKMTDAGTEASFTEGSRECIPICFIHIWFCICNILIST